jgi:hypothetical protein
VLNPYTYTLETIIQAGRKGIPVESVPIEVNGDLRPSRLMKNTADYIRRSIFTIVRIFVVYKPLRFFTILAAITALPGIAGMARFLAYAATGQGGGHIQSLIISGALVATGAIFQMGGLMADVIAANRRLLEDIRSRQLRSDIEARRGRAAADPAPKAQPQRTLKRRPQVVPR